MTKRQPDGVACVPRGRLRSSVRVLGVALAAEAAAGALVTAAASGVLGSWPQQQADRLIGASEGGRSNC